MVLRFLLTAGLVFTVLPGTPSTATAGIVTFVDNQAGFAALTQTTESELAGNFGAAPAVGGGPVASLTRTGSLFSYTVENRDTLAEINNTDLLAAAGGTIGGLYFDTDGLLDIESPASQGGVSSTSFGVDSSGGNNNNSSGGIASRNAAVFTFGGPVSAFNVNLIDFEASAGQEGLLVLGNGGNIIHTEALDFNDGNGVITNFGIIGSSAWQFDQAVFVLGDFNDDDITNGFGGTEFFATADAIVGIAVPEPSSTALIGMLALCLGLNRRKS